MPIVCIAGMHRSGTSMVARLLNLCGLYLGEESELTPPGPDNSEGYWENREFQILNDEILAELGGAWDSPPDPVSQWELRSEMGPLRARAEKLIQRFSHHQLWGWKDPRNSLTLPFWSRLLPSMKVVVCLRNPLEVAQSLLKRNYLSAASAFNLWLDYNQRLLQGLSPQNYIITHYHSYFDHPQDELRRVLSVFDAHVSEASVKAAIGTISVPSRNNHATLIDLLMTPPPTGVLELYEELCAQAGPGYQSLLETDPIRRLAIVRGPERRILGGGEGDKAHQLAEKERVIELLSARATEEEQLPQMLELVSARIADKDHALRALAAQMAEKDHALRALAAQVTEIERVRVMQVAERDQAMQALTANFAGGKQQLQALAEEVSRKEADLQEVHGSRAWMLIEFLRRVRLKLAPQGSLRERAWYRVLRVLAKAWN